MTLDTALLYRPTDALLSPSNRKFFPFKIPNSHHQLRHYISTADPGRIYVAVERAIYAIHLDSHRREIVTIVTFEPKCLTAGLGWIAIGGTQHGDCAFVNVGDACSSSPVPGSNPPEADVDTPLPLGLDPESRRVSPWAPGEWGTNLDLGLPSSARRQQHPEVQIHEFGGSIVNSITIHRLPAINRNFTHEDIAVLSNNDTTVSIYSLTQSEMLHAIRHPVCMNYAIISPDSRILAAVGDDNKIWFYGLEYTIEKQVHIPRGKKLVGWKWPLIRCVDLDSDPQYDDRCCFTIAFSPSSHLCAVGSQAGVITVFDVESVCKTRPEKDGREDILCVFHSSRSYYDGGAVRCMTFSPLPWDLLVWVEDHGRFGIADVRQAFSRRQVVSLDTDAADLEHVRLIKPGHIESDREDEPSGDSGQPRADIESMRADLIQDLTDRERQIIDFLNSSRWASSIEEGPSLLPRIIAPVRNIPHGEQHTPPFSPSPPSRDEPPSSRRNRSRERNAERTRGHQHRRRSSIIASPGNQTPGTQSGRNLQPPNAISLRWSESPGQMSDNPSETGGPSSAGPSGSRRATATTATENNESSSSSNGNTSHGTDSARRSRLLLNWDIAAIRNDDENGNASGNRNGQSSQQRQRGQRAGSIPRRVHRPEISTSTITPAQREETFSTINPPPPLPVPIPVPNSGPASGSGPGPYNTELRTTLAAERLRVQRQAAVEESNRLNQWEQQYRRLRDVDQRARSPRWIRSALSDLDTVTAGHRERERETGVGTAGVGWGADGRTLYIGTVEGIFEYQVNVQDRKTFPGFSCR